MPVVPPRPSRGSTSSRTLSLSCLLVTVLCSSAVLLDTGSALAAPAPASQSTGRFLSGSLGATDLDTVAAIEGEAAQSTGGKNVTRYNSLEASALAGAVRLPLTGVLQLPGGNVVSLGAVSQYAQADADGSALGASGAIDNSGGIAVGGQSGRPADASIDLTGLGGSAVAGTLGDLKLSLGALSAQARQAPGSHGSQQGRYQLGALTLDLTAPGLAALIGPLITRSGTVIAGLATAFNGAGLPLTVTGIANFPNLVTELSSVSADQGAVTASLPDGRVHIDVARLLAASGLELNHLPPNTDLMPYLAKALATALPAAVTALIDAARAKVTSGFGGLGFSIAGKALDAAQLAQVSAIGTSLQKSLAASFTQVSGQLGTAVFGPLAARLGQLLDIVVNVQSAGGGTFTERAVRLSLGAQAVLNLASASVGPSLLAPVRSQVLPTATARPAAAAPRSAIKIDAGRGPAEPAGSAPLAVLGVLLLVTGAAGGLVLRVRRARTVRHG